jgi:enoyl-CoA hydratase/carnithine racemase
VSPYRASAGFTEDWKHFGFSVDDGVATLTFDRPKRLNALTFDVYADLRDLLAELPHREEVRVLVLTGTGKGFCSGGDVEAIIGALQSADARELLDFTRMTGAVVQAMRESPIPIVAGVNGVAAGLGAHLAYACDLVVAADDARFIEVFVRRGIALDAGGGFLLPRHVGLHRAKELVFFGDDLTAQDAERLGLVNKVVPAAELEKTVRDWAERLAQGPTFAIGLSKRILNRSLQADMDTLFAEEAFTQALVANSEDMREGIRSFMEKRPPAFKGR